MLADFLTSRFRCAVYLGHSLRGTNYLTNYSSSAQGFPGLHSNHLYLNSRIGQCRESRAITFSQMKRIRTYTQQMTSSNLASCVKNNRTLFFSACFLFLYLNPSTLSAFNGLNNPSFEQGSSSSAPAGWSFGPGTSIGYNIGNYVASGNRSFWIARSRNSPYLAAIYQNVTAKSAHTYELDFYAGTHNPSFSQIVALEFYNPTGTLLRRESVEINHNVHPTNLLAAYSLSAVAPENTSFLRVIGTTNGDYLKLDAMELSETPPTSFPVEWIDFQATAHGADAKLSWATASELNASHFEVERSIDGVVYEQLGQVAAVGASQSIQTYAYTDRNVTNLAVSTLFYRLRQLDLDGSFSYSNVIELNQEENFQFDVNAYPVPAHNELTLDLAWAQAAQKVQITNLYGQLLFSKDINQAFGTESIRLEVASWPTGTYIVSLIGADRITTKKILKQ